MKENFKMLFHGRLTHIKKTNFASSLFYSQILYNFIHLCASNLTSKMVRINYLDKFEAK